MSRSADSRGWVPALENHGGPAYLAIADALETDLANGRVKPGDLLPTQRELAQRLGVNFTTITRAYAEAHRRGLVVATVGRGTFATDPNIRKATEPQPASRDYELSVNAPPMPSWLTDSVQECLGRLAPDQIAARQLLSYDARLGIAHAREAGATWLQWRGVETTAAQVAVTGGAQHALTLILSTFLKPNDRVVTESLAYPGLHAAAITAGVGLVPVAIDGEGIRPDDLEAVCERERPAALFCVPTLHNPTTATMSMQRRRDILAIARRHRLRVVEDDICGALRPDAIPLAGLSPDQVIHITSLSKCVAPGLRTGFVALPSSDDADRLAAALRTSLLMLPPIPLFIASQWIADGTARRAVGDIRGEMVLRTQLARDTLGDAQLLAPAGALHGWLQLSPSTTAASVVAQAHQQGVRIAPSDWYATPGALPAADRTANAVRITFGAEQDRRRLQQALSILSRIVAQPSALSSVTL